MVAGEYWRWFFPHDGQEEETKEGTRDKGQDNPQELALCELLLPGRS
jgi:hypothetical protein